jgi:hypothetical protein
MKKNTNKKGQFFSLYLVFITIFFIAVVLMLYYVMSQSIENRLISPEEVLDVVNLKNVFEIQEEFLFKSCIREQVSLGGVISVDPSFLGDVQTCFYDRVLKSPPDWDSDYSETPSFGEKEFRGFLFVGISNSGTLINPSSIQGRDNWKNFLEAIYSFSLEEDYLLVNRSPLEKSFHFEVAKNDKINFPVDFVYSFSKNMSFNVSEILVLDLSPETHTIEGGEGGLDVVVEVPRLRKEEGFACDNETWLDVDCRSPLWEKNFRKELFRLGAKRVFYLLSLEDVTEVEGSEFLDFDLFYKGCEISGWLYDNYAVAECLKPFPLCNENHPDYDSADSFKNDLCDN